MLHSVSFDALGKAMDEQTILFSSLSPKAFEPSMGLFPAPSPGFVPLKLNI